VYVVNGTGNLTNDTISGNDATNAAGAGFCGCDVAVHGLVRNDTIVGNVATQHGGGLAADGGSQGSTLAVESTTIDGNSANGGGGAFLATGWLPTVVNTIIGKNGTATDDRFYNCYYGSYYGGGVTSLGHNIDYTSTCGLVAANGDNKHDQTNTDPKLGPLQDNGGLTRTEAPSTSSPAVDAGDGSANVCPERDQRGTKRPLDGDNDGTVACDIGAVEIGPPTAAITPASLQFGDVRVGDTSPAQNVTVKNTGGSDLTISQINLAANDFHMDQTGDHCIGGTVLHVGQQCTLPVTLAPTSTGDKSGTISFSHDGGTTAPVTLTGKGTPGPTPAVTTDPVTELDFPSTTVGHTDTESVTVKNTGEAPLHISGWDVSNLGGDSAFKAGSGGTCTAGGDVAVGKSCTVKVDFTPGGVKTFNGALDINDNAPGSPHHVSLKGDGTPAAAPSVSTDPSNVDFGSVYTSTSPRPSRSVTVHNGGTATLSVSKIDVLNDGGDSAFYKSGGTCSEGGTVAVGSDCTVQVSFAPTDAKDYTATLVLTDNAQGGAQYVDLGGTGKKDTTPPTIAWGSPTDGKRVEQGEKLQVSFDCGDSETGVAVCQVSHEYDPVSYGQQLPTTTLGKHNLNAIVRDGAGNITNAHIVYYVDPVPPAEAKNAAGSNAANTPSSTSGATLQKTGIVTTIKAEKPETAIGQVSGVISSGGANVISSGGGNVISSGGGNVISAGGGNVISAGGGNVISAGGGNFANRASVRHKSKPKQVLLATGGYKFKSPGTAKLVVKLTKAGKSLIKKLRAAAAKARKHHKRVKPVKLAYTLIVGNINGVPGTPAAKATRYIKIKL
ncbi:MAG: trimeric autotransporter adhesin, partial [Solirubrobacteraceae bacterium]|nr:trimeric autotransporter adhesin [Solirubrobacteraceae bacterium]